jgi:hypothetical protein
VNDMNVTCGDCERILKDGTAAEWTALESHAGNCAACAEERRVWKSLSVAAQELRDYTANPGLWPRMERALAEQAASKARSDERWNRLKFWQHVPMGWQTAAASVLAVVMAVSAGWFYLHGTRSKPSAGNELLRSKALADVERTESAYVEAIDKLGAEAKPQLDSPATPLLANYQEKLLLLDSAIADLRAQAGMNPSNAQLRYQLLAMYQEKQRTLEEVLEAKQQ